MDETARAPYGAAAGAVGVALFAVGGAVIGQRPDFGGGGVELAAYLEAHRTRVQVGAALLALAMPLLTWFVATVAALASETGSARARRAGTAALACGIAFVALFAADIAMVAASALRPRSAETIALLRDLEFMLIGMTAFLGAGLALACAALALRARALWPRWVGWLALAAAAAYALRIGTLFTTDGPFAADGALGLWVPAGGLAAFIAVASLTLAARPR